ncbi:hypothetical protein GCM10010317_008730 [Streptomyces mirabilis]|nr:hypothetical protein GCM10010317_008730 [Streptomyces mirabilis]
MQRERVFMQVHVGVDEVTRKVGELELRSLYSWLQADRQALRHAAPELGTAVAPVPGSQGQVIDIVSLVVSSSFSAASLAGTIVSWRATRPRRPVLTVRRPDGTTITISDSSPDEAVRLLEELTREPE